MCQAAKFQGFNVAIWRELAFSAPIRKGRRNDLHPFLLYLYYISSTLPARQTLQLYFPRRFIGLRGKSPNWGLDKVCPKPRGAAGILRLAVR